MVVASWVRRTLRLTSGRNNHALISFPITRSASKRGPLVVRWGRWQEFPAMHRNPLHEPLKHISTDVPWPSSMVGRGAIALAHLLLLVRDTSGLPGTFSKMQPVKPREFGLLESPPRVPRCRRPRPVSWGSSGPSLPGSLANIWSQSWGMVSPKALVISKC